MPHRMKVILQTQMAPNKQPSLLNKAHQYLQSRLYDGAIAIDATLGNGHDTLFLTQQVSPTGVVYGFDIQVAALNTTRNRLQQAHLQANARLCLSCHTQMAEHIPAKLHGKVAAIMFNLGYLPGADKQLITRHDSTLAALTVAVELLALGGIMSILAYPGHAGGDIESAAVENWCTALSPMQYHTNLHVSNQPTQIAPRLWLIEKIAPN